MGKNSPRSPSPCPFCRYGKEQGEGGGRFVGPRRFGRGKEKERMNSFRKSCGTKIDELVKSRNSIEFVIPAKAGIQLF